MSDHSLSILEHFQVETATEQIPNAEVRKYFGSKTLKVKLCRGKWGNTIPRTLLLSRGTRAVFYSQKMSASSLACVRIKKKLKTIVTQFHFHKHKLGVGFDFKKLSACLGALQRCPPLTLKGL